MADVEVSDVRSSNRQSKERNKNRYWNTSFSKDSQDSTESSGIGEKSPRGKQCNGNTLNSYLERKQEPHAKGGARETKRKRTRYDNAACDVKIHHRDSSLGSSDGSSSISQDPPRRNKYRRKPIEIETDAVVLARRQKQIDYGKNTIGYDRYCDLVPREKRQRDQPSTPPKDIKYSRRAWDGLVKIWRQKLHSWDPPSDENEAQKSTDSPGCNSNCDS